MSDMKAKRIFSREVNRIFRLFSADFKYQLPPTTDGTDDFGNPTTVDSDWQNVTEPIITVGSSATATLGNQAQLVNGTNAETYAYEWFSRLDLPMKTAVEYKGKQFNINKRVNYSDVAGIFIYYLQGRSDSNG